MEGPEHEQAFDIRVNGERVVTYTKRSTLFSRKDLVFFTQSTYHPPPRRTMEFTEQQKLTGVIGDFAGAIRIDRETAPSLFSGAAS